MKYIFTDSNDRIKGVFDREVQISNLDNLYKVDNVEENIIGKRIGTMSPEKMKIAIVCNWRTPCGISTYSKYLVDALRSKVNEIKIF
jgi:hypothetical protein